MTKTNLAGRAGRWSANHWKTAFFGWLAFAIAAVAIGSAVGAKTISDSDTSNGESAKAEKILERAGFQEPAMESVLVQSRTHRVSDPAFKATIARTTEALNGLKDVEHVQRPQVAEDGHSALIQFDIAGKSDDADKKVGPMLKAVAAVDEAAPTGFRVEEFGLASANKELNDTLGKDFQKAEFTSLPVTLVILLLAFGALVAASLPVLLAFSAVLGSIGLYTLFTHVVPGDVETTSSVILMIGMAVGIDYSLFYLRREREERHEGLMPRAALLKTAATSGQAVLVSGLTVMIAMAGMLFAGNKIFTSLGFGASTVVLVSVVGSLSVLPALLAKLGDRVDKGRIPYVGRRKHDATESRVWAAVLRRVLARPRLAVLVSGGALLAATAPILTMHTKLPSFVDLPHSLPIVATYERVVDAFPGAPAPATVVIEADDVTSPQVQSQIAALKRQALASGKASKPITVAVNPAHTVARVDIPLAGKGDDDVSIAALGTLRGQVIPQTVGTLPNTQVAVTGLTAGTKDFNDQMKSRMPIVIAFVLGLAFLLLLVTFRSIVVPLTAIALNLLSVGAAYGLLVAIFQHSWAEGMLGFTSNGAITSWLPLFLFVVLFGLSMDYHVFIVSRIKELVDRGVPNDEAVSRGIRATAGTVTSAAVVMIAVFAIFATLRTLDMKQMGIGLATAVLIDATVVRAVLLPATMKLLGDWNWYLPKWLDWLPSMTFETAHVEEHEAPPAIAA
jgi:RND superfamily putative drug exporter